GGGGRGGGGWGGPGRRGCGPAAAPGLAAPALAGAGRPIRLWIRDGAATRVETIAFTPFLLAAEEALVGGAAGLLTLTHLNGAGGLCWLARFGSWSAALAARERCREATGVPANAPDAP